MCAGYARTSKDLVLIPSLCLSGLTAANFWTSCHFVRRVCLSDLVACIEYLVIYLMRLTMHSLGQSFRQTRDQHCMGRYGIFGRWRKATWSVWTSKASLSGMLPRWGTDLWVGDVKIVSTFSSAARTARVTSAMLRDGETYRRRVRSTVISYMSKLQRRRRHTFLWAVLA